jgi:leucyl-tRNA synthetase
MDLQSFIKLLAPFAPHMTEELWQQISNRSTLAAKGESVHCQPWPTFDAKHLQEKMIEIVIQVNGKVRDRLGLSVEAAAEQKRVEEQAKKLENTSKFLTGPIRKVIYIPGKVINFVI